MEGKRVLVVQEDPEVAITLQHNLECAGYTAKAVFSVESALDALALFAPDLVVIEISLAHPETFSVLKEIRQRDLFNQRLYTPVIVISDHGLSLSLGHEMATVSAFLSKPYTLDELLITMQSLLSEKKAA